MAAAEAELERAPSAALAAGEPAPTTAYAAALDRYLGARCGRPRRPRRARCATTSACPDRAPAPTASLSGGQAARASLAAVLLSRFDVFLLDEPTNDLDFAGLDRLERFLDEVAGGVVVVSHDRAFLERTITRCSSSTSTRAPRPSTAAGWPAYLDARADRPPPRRGALRRRTATKRARLEDRARRQRQWAAQGARAGASARPDDNDKYVRQLPDQHAPRSWPPRCDPPRRRSSGSSVGRQAVGGLGAADRRWRRGPQRRRRRPARGAVVERGGFRLGPVDLEITWGERVAISGRTARARRRCSRRCSAELAAGRRRAVARARRRGRRARPGAATVRRRPPLLDAFVAATGVAATGGPLAAGQVRARRRARAATGARRCRRASAPGPCWRCFSAAGVNCLVLDEPTNHLDLPAIEQLEQALEHVRRHAARSSPTTAGCSRRCAITRTVAVVGGQVVHDGRRAQTVDAGTGGSDERRTWLARRDRPGRAGARGGGHADASWSRRRSNAHREAQPRAQRGHPPLVREGAAAAAAARPARGPFRGRAVPGEGRRLPHRRRSLPLRHAGAEGRRLDRGPTTPARPALPRRRVCRSAARPTCPSSRSA